jgi:hypothetical protein
VEVHPHLRLSDLVYRRVPPLQWDPKGLPQEAAFIPRPSDNDELSVYRADLQTPRGLLMLLLQQQLAKAQDSDPEKRRSAERWLRKNGRDVDALISSGWHVVWLEAREFTVRGFRLSAPDAEGHIGVTAPDVPGTSARVLFETYAGTLCSAAREAEYAEP